MWRNRARWLVGWAALASGCGPLTHAAYYLVVERTQFCESADKVAESVRDRLVADDAWDHFASAHLDQAFSPDFACGFKDGFADYIEAGGTGEPPPMPPRRYWQAGYETPQGHLAIEDWFAGFRQGAAAARASGLRQWVTIPIAPQPLAGPLPSATIVDRAVEANPEVPSLPAPRVLPDKAGPQSNLPTAQPPAQKQP